MGLSNAERQAIYRQRRKEAYEGEGEQRLNLYIRTRADRALKRLAAHHGVTQKQMLEQLIQAADQAILEELDPDSSAWQAYFERRGCEE